MQGRESMGENKEEVKKKKEKKKAEDREAADVMSNIAFRISLIMAKLFI